MSYLDIPRLQFGGLFFTNPDTINNYSRSYDPSTQLTNASGAYISGPPDGGPAGWNALGVAQLWLEQCTVLTAVDAAGTVITSGDPVLGAAVESPSPKTPKSAPDGTFYDLAKMVDLDTDQQGRSAVYGLRLYVTLPGGGGFSGLVPVFPELQYMAGRIPVRGGSWTAVGTWMGQITDVTWSGDLSSSPLLEAFRQACTQGIAVKLSMDLHQNDPKTRLISGDMFCYGRLLGSLGPILPGELPQVVPGRMVTTAPAAAAPEALSAKASPAPPVSRPMTIDDRFRQRFSEDAPAGLATASRAAAPIPWNPAPAIVKAAAGQSLLHLDLGSSISLQYSTQDGRNVSDGRFAVEDGIAVGYLDAAGTFQPFTHGAVSFIDQYQYLDSMSKQCYLIKNSAIVDIPLTASEATAVAGLPLAVSVTGTVLLEEPADGLLLGTDPLGVRLEPGQSTEIRLMARKFGLPLVGERPISWQGQIYAVDSDADQPLVPSTDVTVAWNGVTDSFGLATLTISASSQVVTLPAYRVPFDSQCYYIFFLDGDGQAIGDGSIAGFTPNLSVLRFQQYDAPAVPDWNADVGPILKAYARLYPGMQDRLDIGDQATVKGFASTMLARMSAAFSDPAYMPVTRDLSPAKVTMICEWLKTQTTPTA